MTEWEIEKEKEPTVLDLKREISMLQFKIVELESRVDELEKIFYIKKEVL